MSNALNAAYRDKVRDAAFRAIAEASMVEQDDGRRVAVLMSGEATEALLFICAALAATSNETNTPQKSRIFCEAVAKRLNGMIKAMRDNPDLMKALPSVQVDDFH